MTTLLLSEVFPPRVGGSGRWFYELYRRWPAGSVRALVGPCEGDAAFDEHSGVPTTRLDGMTGSWSITRPGVAWRVLRLAQTVHRAARERGATALHCGRAFPEGLIGRLAHARGGPRFALYVHGEELNWIASSRQFALLARRVFPAASVVVANSRNTARQLLEGRWVQPHQLEVLHPGVDATHYQPATRDAAARRRLGWEGRRVVLTVGRLQARKGQDRMIDAVARLRDTYPDLLYAVAGDGPTREALHAQVDRLALHDHVRFLGEIDADALHAAYQQCDLFVLPNRDVGGDTEGFGMVLLEAQACGKPVLAGRSGGTAETMIEGTTGRLVDCREAGPLADAVADLLADPTRLEAMGRAARDHVASRFDWAPLAKRSLELFESRFGAEPRVAA